MLEAEWAFVGSIGDLCDVSEASIKQVLRLQPDRDFLQAETAASWALPAAAESDEPLARFTTQTQFLNSRRAAPISSLHLGGALRYRASMNAGLQIRLLTDLFL